MPFMDVYEELLIVLGQSITSFIVAPFRRIGMLLTVEEDLKRERILPQKGFSGIRGCVNFMYQSGGIRTFYRGALGEVGVLCVYKFVCSRYIIVPIIRRIPLRVGEHCFAATFLHTLIITPLLSPPQMLVDTIIANMVTDFIPKSIAQLVRERNSTVANNNNNQNLSINGNTIIDIDNLSTSNDKSIMQSIVDVENLSNYSNNNNSIHSDANDSIVQFLNNNSIYRNSNNLKNESFAIPTQAEGRHFQPRFNSLVEVIGAVRRTVPIFSVVSKLVFLDFMERFISSSLYNKALGYLMGSGSLGDGECFASKTAWVVAPVLVSLGTALITYPLQNFLFTHFVRVKLYERLEVEALKRLEEEKEYPTSQVRNESFSTAVTRMRRKCSQRQLYIEDEAEEADPDAVCSLIEGMCNHLFHEEVRDYLRSSVEMDGFFSIYTGFSVYVMNVFSSVTVSKVVRLASEKIMSSLF